MKIENVIYIITNPQFPGYVKIGYASDLKSRLASLNTGLIIDFEPYAVYETIKKNGDTEIHDLIKLLNPILRSSKFEDGKEKKKEFFKLDPEEAFKIFEHIAIVSGTRRKLYKVDKNLNKIPGSDGVNDKDDIGEKATANTDTHDKDKEEKNHLLPDGLYTMETKLKKSGLVAKATMEVRGNKFILKAGSFVAPENERSNKLKTWFTRVETENNTLLHDVEYKSVSTAACIVRGKETNGWDIWKDKNGHAISIYRNNN
jgi:hypothetical protein